MTIESLRPNRGASVLGELKEVVDSFPDCRRKEVLEICGDVFRQLQTAHHKRLGAAQRLPSRDNGMVAEVRCVAGSASSLPYSMNFAEKKLYHQVHPLKLAVDIIVTPIALYCLWEHRVLPVLLVGFVPPVAVSLGMLKWTPDLERVKKSAFGCYIKKYMTPLIELLRLLTLAPMAYGAWNHDWRFILLGLVILVIAWCNGVIRQLSRNGYAIARFGIRRPGA